MGKKRDSKIQEAVDWATAEACRLLTLFGETDWEFRVDYRKGLNDVASTHVQRRRHHFWIDLGPPFIKESLKDRQNTVLHEVLHVLQTGWYHLVWFTLDASSMPEGERKMFQSAFVDQMELHTDRLAMALAGKL